jgi:hypothetical protein
MRDIISEFISKHGDKFTYEEFNYINNKQWILVTCDRGHSYKTQILTHLKSKGCPYCRGVKRDANLILNSLKEKHNNYYDYSLSSWNKIDDHITIICPEHGQFQQILKLHLKGHRCQKCSNRYRKTNDDFLKNLRIKFPDINFDISEFKNSKTRINAFCKKHGLISFQPNFKKHVCKKCFQEEKNFDNFLKKSLKIYNGKYDYSISEYINNQTPIKIIDAKFGVIFEQTPQGHLKGECRKVYWSNRNNTDIFIENSRKIHGSKFDYSKTTYISSKLDVEIICPIHGTFYQTPNNHLKGNNCPSCNRFNIKQNKIYDFISQFHVKVHQNERKLLNGKEIDIYIPELKIGFEFNGLYWHSEMYRERSYHLNKTKECLNSGIELFHIWEDDWNHKQDIIKSMIVNRLGKTVNKIYARKCQIREISDNKIIRDFLGKNHIQGFVGSKIKLGLFYNEELVSIMTFGNLRKSLGQKSQEGTYEMLRFSNLLNTNVVGGASKLFKYFIKNYDIKEVISYSDSSRGQGNLYNQLGFNLISETVPNYYWVIDGKRHHRFNFRKDKLVKEGADLNKTEIQIMSERGYYRIFDCGNKKWSYVN